MTGNSFQKRIQQAEREKADLLNQRLKSKQDKEEALLEEQRKTQAAFELIRQSSAYAQILREANSPELRQVFEHFYSLAKPTEQYDAVVAKKGFFREADVVEKKQRAIPFSMVIEPIQYSPNFTLDKGGKCVGIRIFMPLSQDEVFPLEFGVRENGEVFYIELIYSIVQGDEGRQTFYASRYVYPSFERLLTTLAESFVNGMWTSLKRGKRSLSYIVSEQWIFLE